MHFWASGFSLRSSKNCPSKISHAPSSQAALSFGGRLPNLIGGVVLGYIWQIIINCVLSLAGEPLLALNTAAGYWGLIILMCWQQVGYMMIIYIAGLQSIPESLTEAAQIDGATGAQILF